MGNYLIIESYLIDELKKEYNFEESGLYVKRGVFPLGTIGIDPETCTALSYKGIVLIAEDDYGNVLYGDTDAIRNQLANIETVKIDYFKET